MEWNCIKSYYLVLIGLSVFGWFVVASYREHRFEIHPLCHSSTYGSVLSTHTDIRDIVPCTALCSGNSQCESCTYDETSNVCSLNSVIRLDIPTCALNVQYAQKREFKCVSSGGSYKICGLDLYAVSGELTGYIEVYFNGVWGTVCDDFWLPGNNGIENADVFCRSFGYSGGYPIYPLESNDVIYHGPIVITGVQCVGTESHLLECQYTYPVGDCGHHEDVAVRCYI